MVPKPKDGTWAALPCTTKGFGHHFTSPRKVKNPRKTKTLVSFPGQEAKRQCLLTRLDDLLNHRVPGQPSTCEAIQDTSVENSIMDTEMMDSANVEEDANLECAYHPPPTQRACLDHFFNNWKAVIPTIVRPYLEYINKTLGKPTTEHVSSLSACSQDCTNKWVSNITCLYFDCQSLSCPINGDMLLTLL